LARRTARQGGVVVIGLGRFGKALALELEHYGVEVLGLERDARKVQDLEVSVLTAFALRTLQVPNTWAKAMTETQANILEQIGIGHVVRPEYDMGRRVAHLVRGKMLDYIEFDDGYAIVKTTPPRSILGRSIADVGVRSRYGVTIVGIKPPGKEFSHATPESVVEEGDLIIVAGERRTVEQFSDEA